METNQSENLIQILVIFLPMAGIIIGAVLQHSFSKNSESEKFLKDLETQSYVDFIKAASGINTAQREKDSKMEKEYTNLMIDAKARICIHGNHEVASSVATFWRYGAKLTTNDERKRFTDILKTIRKTNKLKPIDNKDLSQLLFSLDL